MIERHEDWGTQSPKMQNFEMLYWDKYALKIPIDYISAGKIRNGSGAFLAIFYLNGCKLNIDFNNFGMNSPSWISKIGQGIFQEICDNYNLSTITKTKLYNKLAGKLLFNTDFDLLKFAWSKDWTKIDLGDLSLSELISYYFVMNTKLQLVKRPGGQPLLPVIEIDTGYFRGLSFGNNVDGFILELFDKEDNKISVEYLHEQPTNQVQKQTDFGDLITIVSSLQMNQSSEPANDMLKIAEKYLNFDPEPLPQVAMLFLKSAQQYEIDQDTKIQISTFEKEIINLFLANLNHKVNTMKLASLRWLVIMNLPDVQVIQSLIAISDDPDPIVRMWVAKALCYYEAPHSDLIIPVLLKLSDDNNLEVRIAAIESLGGGKYPDYQKEIELKIIELTNDGNPNIRAKSIELIPNIIINYGNEENLLSIVKNALNDKNEIVSEAAESVAILYPQIIR